MLFNNREEAGESLARALAMYRRDDVVVHALPRGGMVPARAVADALRAPLDLVLTRKLRHPRRPGHDVGALTEDGQVILDERVVVRSVKVWLERERRVQEAEIERRRAVYLGGREPLPVHGRTTIIVDDGVATGHTMQAAAMSLRAQGAAWIVVAAPVASAAAAARLTGVADDVVLLAAPGQFQDIRQFYRDFAQVSDAQVLHLLRRGNASPRPWGCERASTCMHAPGSATSLPGPGRSR